MSLTLEKIGELAGVSRSTVSRVINNYPHIKPEVRENVLRVIEETGYQPHIIARSLASKASRVIGLMIPSIINAVFTDPYYPKLTQGIAQACNEAGYILTLILFHSPEEERQNARRIVNNSLMDGIIITAEILDDPIVPDLIAANIPFVQIGRPHQTDKISYVDSDNHAGGKIATEYLIECGYQRIAQIATAKNTAGFDRSQGYQDALTGFGMQYDENLVAYGDYTRESGYNGMKQLLSYQPDAVFCQSDTMALGALQAIREAGLSVPDDLAMVGFDDLPPALLAEPNLTTVRQPIHEIGMMAVQLLLDILEHGTQPPRHRVLPVELVQRETVINKAAP